MTTKAVKKTAAIRTALVIAIDGQGYEAYDEVRFEVEAEPEPVAAASTLGEIAEQLTAAGYTAAFEHDLIEGSTSHRNLLAA